ncbi:hypothetical protein EVAR_93346_1 [Eumeta japonica]|uniref:Uncharacterized protein n=1 Tax=Eumeta variegata TaxID=151549 RepID=A0A4C1UTB0_EUMVA|nr:hypothetical protein EVAR_93346_1 [Eumeta japonica]
MIVPEFQRIYIHSENVAGSRIVIAEKRFVRDDKRRRPTRTSVQRMEWDLHVYEYRRSRSALTVDPGNMVKSNTTERAKAPDERPHEYPGGGPRVAPPAERAGSAF